MLTTRPSLKSVLAVTALTIFSLLLSAEAQTTSDSGEQGRAWALVVGISRYQKLPGGQQLQFAERDATDFAEAIAKTGAAAERVRLLTGQQATAANIRSAVGNWLARSVAESDTVYIFFSGHGYVERDFAAAYLLGYDSDPKDAYGTAVSVSELSHALTRRVRAGRVLVIADSIRRDLFSPETDPDSSTVFFDSLNTLAASRPGLTAIVANSPAEYSREGQRWGGRGVFTKHLLDGLAGPADKDRDGSITAIEAFEFTASKVAEDTSNRQRPWRTETSIARIVIARSSIIAQSSPPSQSRQAEIRREPEAPPKVPAPTDNRRAATESSSPPVRQPQRSESSPRETATSSDPTRSQPEAPRRTVDTRRPAADPPPTGQIASTVSPASPVESGRVPVSTTTSPAPAARRPAARPPDTARVNVTSTARSSTEPQTTGSIATANLPPPPRPSAVPPRVSTVAAAPARSSPETIRTTVPATQPGAPPSPLALQIEAALAMGALIEPRSSNAWDLYQRLSQESSSSELVAQLKPKLASAFLGAGRAIVSGDVRVDNISDKVEEFKRAGQLLSRVRMLSPDNGEAQALEKLCASAALIALQFYDEAERSLSQLQGERLAAIENALGIVYRGKLDDYRAERAFKRAVEMDSKWAAPHYNLALLYKSQKREEALTMLARAAELAPSNAALQTALGDEQFERQQWQQAIESYKKAVSIRPEDDTLRTKLGHALYSNGMRDEANREYQKAADLRKRQP